VINVSEMGYMAHVGDRRGCVQGVGEGVLLKWVFQKLGGDTWAGFSWLRKGQVAGCGDRDEPLVS
jgi:hypothetical protein